jgi:hypothetical protein
MLADGQGTCPTGGIITVFDRLVGLELSVLSPYVARIDLMDVPETTCPVASLAHSLSHFVACCHSDFKPSKATWRAIVLFHTNTAYKILHRSDVRDAAWRLQELHLEGEPTGEHWRTLDLFFLLGIHCLQNCSDISA